MSKFPDTERKISSSCDGREICDTPKVSEKPESARFLRRSKIGIGSTERLLKFALVKMDPGARSRTCEKRPG